MFDVVVIGGGLAGATAALELQALGCKVALSRRGWGATAMSTGALDIAYTPALQKADETGATLEDHIRDIITHRPKHPYSVLGMDRTVQGVHQGLARLSPYLGVATADFERHANNRLYLSALGTLIPAATTFCGDGVWHVNLPGRFALVQFAADAHFAATRILLGAQSDAKRWGLPTLNIQVVEIAGDPWVGFAPAHVARAFDDIQQLDRLAQRLGPVNKEFDGLILPPYMGLNQAAVARRYLADRLGLKIYETLAKIPSVAGIRLQQALDAGCLARGVTVLAATKTMQSAEGRLTSLRTVDNLDISFGSAVLATGRFVSGGVVWEQHCREALLDLPVVTELGVLEEDNLDAVVRETPMESHPLMTAGVQVDSNLRPMREGDVAFENLFAAGMIIGGFASRYALSADGVALATGWHAARAAQACLS